MGILAETATSIRSSAAGLPEKALEHCREDLKRTLALTRDYVDSLLTITSSTVTVATETISARLPDSVTSTVENVTSQTHETVVKTIDSAQELAGAGKDNIEKGLQASADKVKSLVNEILALDNVLWTREKLRVLTVDVLAALEDFLQKALPYVTVPGQAAYEKLVLVYGALADWIKKMFKELDDGLVTPGYHRLATILHWVYDASTQTLHTTYTFTNDKILVPVVDFSRNKLIVPATELYENVTDKARDAALRACDLVSQNVAMGTAYADEKFQVLNLLQKALDMSRDMDARMTGGRVEQKLVRPAVDKTIAVATRVDDQYVGGRMQEFVEETKTAFEGARKSCSEVPGSPVATQIPIGNISEGDVSSEDSFGSASSFAKVSDAFPPLLTSPGPPVFQATTSGMYGA